MCQIEILNNNTVIHREFQYDGGVEDLGRLSTDDRSAEGVIERGHTWAGYRLSSRERRKVMG